MATYNGSNFAVAAAPTPSTWLQPEQWGGRVKAISDRVTTTAAGTTADVLKCGKMPKTALPLLGAIRYTGSSTATGVIGYAADTDALGTFTALVTTPVQMLVPTTGAFLTPLTQDQDILVNINTKPLNSGDKIEVRYLFAKD